MKHPGRLSLLVIVLLLAVSAPASTPTSTNVTVEGVVTAVQGNLITLGGGLAVLNVTTATIVSRSDGRSLGVSALAPGVFVRATAGTRNPDGSLAASSVLVGDADTVELKGTLDSVHVGSGTFGLLGLTISVDSQTSFDGKTARGDVRGLSDLMAGDPVEVEAVRSGDSLLATRVSAKGEAESPGDEVDFTGTVESISETSWKISGKSVLVTSETEIEGDPAVGDTVEVRARQAADGTLAAQKIEKVESPEPQTVEVRGILDSISLKSWTISGMVVAINASTEIDGTPRLGASVRGTARVETDGSLTALSLQVEDSGDGGGDGGDGGDGHGGGHDGGGHH